MSAVRPLADLLEDLRDAGFSITVSEHRRVSVLLALDAAWDRKKLKDALRAVVVRDRGQIERFDAVFDRFFEGQSPRAQAGDSLPGLDKPPPQAAEPPPSTNRQPPGANRQPPGADKPSPPTGKRPPRRWLDRYRGPVVAAGVLLWVGVAVLARTMFSGDSSPTGSGDAGTGTSGTTTTVATGTTSSTDVVASRTPGEGEGGSAGSTAVQPPSPPPAPPATAPAKASSTVSSTLPLVTLPTASPLAALPAAPPAADLPSDLSAARLVGPDADPAGSLPWIVALGILSFGLATALIVQGVRRRRARRRFAPGPWKVRLAVPEEDKAIPFRRESIDAAATDLISRSGEDAGMKLDVRRTIERTAAAGGYPHVVLDRSGAPRYAMLIDAAPSASAWRRVYLDLADLLRAAKVNLEVYAFESDPSRCWPAGRPERARGLAEIADRADALLVVGDGEQAESPLDGRPVAWVGELQRFSRRLWLNPLPPSAWTPGAKALSRSTPMVFGTSAAFTAFAPGWEPPHSADDRRRLPEVVMRHPGSDIALESLRRYLGPAFSWLRACVAAGEPDADLAIWLHRRLRLDLSEEDRLRLLTLPWFSARRWPAALRGRILGATDAAGRDIESRTHAAVLELLAESEPPPGTVAYLHWTLDRAVHATKLGKPPSPETVDALLDSPLRDTAKGRLSPLGLFGVRDRVAWALGVLAAVCAAAFGLRGGPALYALYFGNVQSVGLFGDDWHFEVVRYCADWTLRDGDLACVTPLTGDEFRHRASGYEVRSSSGRVLSIVSKSHGGLVQRDALEPRTNELPGEEPAVASWVVLRDSSGQLTGVKESDDHGNELRHLTFSRTSPQEWVVRFLDSKDQPLHVPGSRVVGANWTLDKDGSLQRAELIGADGKPAPLANGAAQIAFERDARGLVVAETYTPALRGPIKAAAGTSVMVVGDAIADTNGIARREYVRNDRGDILVQRGWFQATADTPKEPREDAAGIHGQWVKRDAYGNPLEMVWFGADGRRTRESGDVASVTREYKGGDCTKEAYFAVDGVPVRDEHGVAERTFERDANGRIENETHVGPDGAPTLDDEWVSTTWYSYDGMGNVSEIEYRDTDGALASNRQWVARTKRTYGDSRRMESEEYFDKDGEPTLSRRGCARIHLSYSGDGREIRSTCFSKDRQIVLDNQGVATLVETRDAQGNLVRTEHLGVDGQRVLSVEGVSVIQRTYDDSGREIGIAYLGVDLKPALRNGRYASLSRKLDAWGHEIETRYLGIGGKPAPNERGVSRITRLGIVSSGSAPGSSGELITHFGNDDLMLEGPHRVLDTSLVARINVTRDERGRSILEEYEDLQLAPTTDKSGIGGVISSYDDRGWLTRQSFFRVFALPPDTQRRERRAAYAVGGFAQVAIERDARGLETRVMYFDAEGRPAYTADGIAGVLHSYDDRGNRVEMRYLDTSGQPTASNSGVARVLSRYDERGRLVEEEYKDSEGVPAARSDGVFGRVIVPDAAGRPADVTYLDAQGKPGKDANGVERVLRTYDGWSREIAVHYVDSGGKPVRGKDLVAGYRQSYDERDRVIGKEYFGASGAPAVHKDGYARIDMEYDERDNVRMMSFRDAAGKPICPSVSIHGVCHIRYAHVDGLEVDRWYLNASGKPIQSGEYSHVRSRYDERRRLVEEGFFFGESVPENVTGYAHTTYVYDERNRVLKVEKVDPKLVSPPLHDGPTAHSKFPPSIPGGSETTTEAVPSEKRPPR